MHNKSFFSKFITHITLVAYLFSYLQPCVLMASDSKDSTADLGIEMKPVGTITFQTGAAKAAEARERFWENHTSTDKLADIKEQVQKIDNTWWRYLTPVFWESIPVRTLLALCCKFLRGDPLPEDTKLGVRYTLSAKTLTRSIEAGFRGTLDLILLSASLYLLSIGENPVKTLFTANEKTLLGLITAFVNTPLSRMVAGVPFLFIGGRVLVSNLTQPQPNDKYVQGYTDQVDNASEFWQHQLFQVPLCVPVIAPLTRFVYSLVHPNWHAQNNLSRLVLIDHALWHEQMKVCYTILLKSALEGKSATAASAYKQVYRIAGRNNEDLEAVRIKLKGSSEQADQRKSDEYESHIKAKLLAVKVLKEAYESLPWYDPNKLRAGFYLWKLGHNDSWAVTGAAAFSFAFSVTKYALTSRALAVALKVYLDCPGRFKNFVETIAGYINFSNSRACWDGQWWTFGTVVPDQPAPPYFGNIDDYRDLDPELKVDFSQISVTGEQGAVTLEAIKPSTKVTVTEVDYSNGLIREAEHWGRIFRALTPKTRTIKLNKVSYDSRLTGPGAFNGLKDLTGLEVLDVSNNILLDDASEFGEALRYIPGMRVLRIANTVPSNFTSIARAIEANGRSYRLIDITGTNFGTLSFESIEDFANAVKVNCNLVQLYLTRNGVGAYPKQNIATAEMLATQSNLETLDLSTNALSLIPNVNASSILRAVPPNLVYYFLSGNKIGTYLEDVEAFAESASKMTALKVFDGSKNPLGTNAPLLLSPLANLPLEELYLRGCSLSFTPELLEVLKRPSLKIVDLRDNLLANISEFISVLAQRSLAQQSFKELYMGGNDNLTTAELIQLYGFYPQSVSLEGNAEFAEFYIDNYISNSTTFLDLSGKFPDTPDSIAVLEQLSRLIRLTGFDFSNNRLALPGKLNGLPALSTLFKHPLQFLNLSGSKQQYYIADAPIVEKFYESFAQLTELRTLDAKGFYFNITTLATAIKNWPLLEYADFTGCFTGGGNIIPVLEALKSCPHLRVLILGNNLIGFKNENVTFALADLIANSPALRYVGLPTNFIGSTDGNLTDSRGYLFKVLGEKSLEVSDLGEDFDVDLTDAIKKSGEGVGFDQASAQYFAAKAGKIFKAQCEAEECQGTAVTGYKGGPPPPAPQTSAASSLKPPFHDFIKFLQGDWWSKIWGSETAPKTAPAGLEIRPKDSAGNFTSSYPTSAAYPTITSAAYPTTTSANELPRQLLANHKPIEQCAVPKPTPQTSQEPVVDKGASAVGFLRDDARYSDQDYKNRDYQNGENQIYHLTGLFVSAVGKSMACTLVPGMVRETLEQTRLPKLVINGVVTTSEIGMLFYTTASYWQTASSLCVKGFLRMIGVSPAKASIVASTGAIVASYASGDAVTLTGLAISLGGGITGSYIGIVVVQKLGSIVVKTSVAVAKQVVAAVDTSIRSMASWLWGKVD